MTQTHFFSGDDPTDVEQASCGSILGEKSSLTADWNGVSCLRCLRAKDRLIRASKRDEAHIIDQMGRMADYFKRERLQREAVKGTQTTP